MGDLLIRNVAEALKTDLDRASAIARGKACPKPRSEALREGREVWPKRRAGIATRYKLPLGQRLQAAFARLTL